MSFLNWVSDHPGTAVFLSFVLVVLVGAILDGITNIVRAHHCCCKEEESD